MDGLWNHGYHNKPNSRAAIAMTESDRLWSRSSRFHPLEIIPWFRRFPCSWWRDLIYTFIWNCLIAAFLITIPAMFTSQWPSATWMIDNLIVANCIGYSIHVLFHLAGRTIEPWVHRHGKVLITLFYASIATLGVMIGFMIASQILNWHPSSWFGDSRWVLSVAITSVIVSLILTVVFFWRERSAVAEAALEREQLRAATIERQATLANLRALQAQIEPHFLFNTLANVVSLIHPAPDQAKHMLESFIQYLRASLATSREESTTLALEFELMRTFLAILQIRMGDRLQVKVDLSPGLENAELPPMLLQPLVENAIRHGLETKVEGGLISLSAVRRENSVCISIADTGMGFNGATSNGIGLRNVRERLAGLYGNRARLIIEDNPPCGTRVTVEIPS